MEERLRKVVLENGLTGDPSAGLREPPPALVRVGRLLFFDKILGGEKNVACASCHHPSTAMGDGLRLGRGVGSTGVGFARLAGPGPVIPRNAPSVWNAALFATQFWDGRVTAVDPRDPAAGCRTPDGLMLDAPSAVAAQAMFPVTSGAEMRGNAFPGMTNFQLRASLAARVAAIPEYRSLFQAAFGDDEVTAVRLASAIGAFETHLTVVDTPWFSYVRGNSGAINREMKRGAIVFYEKARCQSCHSGDLSTDLQFHSIGIPQFGPGKGDGTDGHDDFGRERVSGDRADRYRFRTPTLVNVELHGPYGHDGAYASLEAIVRHHLDPERALALYDYDDDQLPLDLRASLRDTRPLVPSIDPLLRERTHLSDDDVENLIAFLRAQTDPRTRMLAEEIPDRVPSGIPIDR